MWALRLSSGTERLLTCHVGPPLPQLCALDLSGTRIRHILVIAGLAYDRRSLREEGPWTPHETYRETEAQAGDQTPALVHFAPHHAECRW